MLGRLDEIAAHAKEQGVRLMVDAEHSYFQVGNLPPCWVGWG